MTKYILVGGYNSKAEDGGKTFAEELITGFVEPVKILICLFARPADAWSEKFTKEKNFFAHNVPHQHLEIKLAQINTFIDQVKWADCIYFHGGRTRILIDALQRADGWKNELKGKTIAGSSAGAHMLARFSYSPEDLTVNKGLGILNVKVLTHYKSDFNAPNVDWDKAYRELDDYGEKLRLIALQEGEFTVVEQP